MRTGDLDVISEYFVISHLEGFDPRPLSLPALQIGKILSCLPGGGSNLVQLRREARLDHPPLPRRLRGDSLRDQVNHLLTRLQSLREPSQRRKLLANRRLYLGNCLQATPQRNQLPRDSDA
ncbi:MAG: hypothetical protein DDT25_00269 [Chloroflexi bacterium]|nr:hypothetical protein [Chloroflexota bacterium]